MVKKQFIVSKGVQGSPESPRLQDSRTLGLWDSVTPDSMTLRLQDFRTPGLQDSETPRLWDSEAPELIIWDSWGSKTLNIEDLGSGWFVQNYQTFFL